ncbi:AP-4-A phosphorylase [Polystyrenella longa]|uniref:AP-4-A phosphorylase n=1 Tax=Polystyrenella longa TaxID=2528007 RepID=A0A518CQF1_9PLAN|nr:HIT domain-containing protein [Polystyrenella longa]QDU81452.1 AP-4-A phosphorylase [Polystyrenella longa]
MTDQHLWAPWRHSYITSDEAPEPVSSGCFLCDYLQQPEDQDRCNLILSRGEHCVVLLNRYPYNNGHLLVAPLRHQSKLSGLTPDEHLECMNLLVQLSNIISEQMNADGFNIGLNVGKVAGAGLPAHLHWHLVPRWNGDNNFMSVTAGTKVISQSLDSLYELLSRNLSD